MHRDLLPPIWRKCIHERLKLGLSVSSVEIIRSQARGAPNEF